MKISTKASFAATLMLGTMLLIAASIGWADAQVRAAIVQRRHSIEIASALPDNIALKLRDIGEKYFAPLMERPEARALWWPRFQRIAAWFAEWEIEMYHAAR